MVPNVEPLLFAMESRFVLFEIIEVYKTVTAVTLGATIITVHLATTDTLTL